MERPRGDAGDWGKLPRRILVNLVNQSGMDGDKVDGEREKDPISVFTHIKPIHI
jgi:hypothetical protein